MSWHLGHPLVPLKSRQAEFWAPALYLRGPCALESLPQTFQAPLWYLEWSRLMVPLRWGSDLTETWVHASLHLPFRNVLQPQPVHRFKQMLWRPLRRVPLRLFWGPKFSHSSSRGMARVGSSWPPCYFLWIAWDWAIRVMLRCWLWMRLTHFRYERSSVLSANNHLSQTLGLSNIGGSHNSFTSPMFMSSSLLGALKRPLRTF